MHRPSLRQSAPAETRDTAAVSPPKSVPRFNSRDLLAVARAIEIEHAGRVYTLRITQANKLILTA